MGLNPVIYIENNSIIARGKKIDTISETYYKSIKKSGNKNVVDIEETYMAIANYNLNFFRYLKNYQGDLIRKNKVYKNYRFYDEREWRFVPELSNDKVQFNLTERKYNAYRKKSVSKPLLDNVVLDFSADDIEYLIVKSRQDIPRLIRAIQGTNNLAKNGDELLELTTRIITIEQLNKDF